MTDEGTPNRFPYMSPNQLTAVRARLKQSVPSVITVDWIIAALDSTEKTARNVAPQLKLLGLVDGEARPTELVYDFKDDETFAKACSEMVEHAYPETLRQAHEDPAADASRVAGWFGRNAKTGEAVAGMQARMYLWLLKAEMPAADDKPQKRRTVKPKLPKKDDPGTAQTVTSAHTPRRDVMREPDDESGAGGEKDVTPPPAPPAGPNLHVDVQVHVAADASAEQIDAIFASMAKHLYGR